jgi:hypothetical protein
VFHEPNLQNQYTKAWCIARATELFHGDFGQQISIFKRAMGYVMLQRQSRLDTHRGGIINGRYGGDAITDAYRPVIERLIEESVPQRRASAYKFWKPELKTTNELWLEHKIIDAFL